jgi:hypothetical protein
MMCGGSKNSVIFFTADNQTMTTIAYQAAPEETGALETERDSMIETLMDEIGKQS